ncbi:U3 small nucleolar ribonucleoprotein protein MPP10 [Bradysia coprophila]|uniref:U3 small nucleolar ribonucleoprotein protein MPP10 n=1 Tax=Bradysia coprophila TaxID=38358 RepID=UPI00187D7B3F|nr:U3 small nucleolar ribonucleoprotein protein MPP10 [Bradysia coprophila]
MILETTAMDNNSQKQTFKEFFKKFQSVTKAPEAYLRVQTEKAEKSRALLKSLFDYVRSKDVFIGKLIPSQISVDHMDDEQIWQQLELMNTCLWSTSLEHTSRLLAGADDKFSLNYKKAGEESEESDGTNEEQSDNEDHNVSHSDSESDSDEDIDETEATISKKDTSAKSSSRKSIVDDKFFKLSEMEAFLESEDKKEMRKSKGTYFEPDDEEIDYFNGDFSEDDVEGDEEDAEANAKYVNFFDADSDDEEEIRRRKREARDAKNKLVEKRKKEDLGLDDSDIDNVDDEEVDELNEDEQVEEEQDDEEDYDEEEGNDKDDTKKGKVSFDMSKNSYRSDSDDHDDDDDNDEEKEDKKMNLDPENKSSFELRQERLRNRITEFEEAALGEKAWQLRGEVTSTSRPQNSLLEEVLEFDSTARPAPIITEETTLQLEDIIKQRIKDKAWNDVERKYKPVNTPQEFRKKLVLDQEKSKESLAQIYEKEYLNELDKIDPNRGEKEEEEPKEHTEIRRLTKTLFLKLDALSNFYYTPKPAIPEAKIITNTPAINMEEVAPIGVSDATLLAPEEVKHRAKGDVLGKSERTSTDKKRERRMKKLKQKSVKIAQEKRTAEKEKLGIRLSSKEEQKKLLNKVTKARNVEKVKETSDGKSSKSSKAFFSQLQDEVSLKTKTKSKRKSSKNEEAVSAKKLKL